MLYRISQNYAAIILIHFVLTIISCIICYICLFTTQAAPLSFILTDITTTLDVIRGWYSF